MTKNSRLPLLAFAWVITRVWALSSGYQILPYPNSQYLFSDVRLYDWWAGNIADGHFPINDPMWQYPPLAALVFLAGYLIAGKTIGFVFLALLADFAIFALLSNQVIKSRNGNVIPVMIWVATPLLMGPIILGRFDVFPTLAVVAALFYSGSPRAFGSLSAIGTLLKVWPVLNLIATPPTKFIKSTLWFLGTFFLGSALLTIWWPNSFTFIAGQKLRGLQIESVGALPYMIWNAGTGSTTSAFQFGSIEVVAAGTGVVSLVMTLIGIGLLGTLITWRLTGKLTNVSPPDIVLLAVLISMCTSRVLSPQYMVWVFGVLAVSAFKPQPNFKKLVALIFTSAFIGQLIYPWLYIEFQQGEVLPTAAHLIRVVALLVATKICWDNIKGALKQERPDPVHAEAN
ncbi:MAG: hypothetical protein WCQ11_01715 [Actinomycetes bacterium]